MKIKTMLIVITAFLTASMNSQTFQRTVSVADKNFHDLNIVPITNGSGDYLVAGNLFDESMENEELFLKRIDQNGIVIWLKKYIHPAFQHIRGFDVTYNNSFIYVTGSVDVSGVKKVFIACIEVGSGNILFAYYYDILTPSLNSRGLHITYTFSDADGDGTSDPGIIVAGFYSDCYNLDTNCTNNFGFVLRTDNSLVPIWTLQLNTVVSSSEDFDFVNGITETIDGFLLTGSATGEELSSGSIQQAVLAHKIDFQGNFLWDQSYIFGNGNDVSIDVFFDPLSEQLYMLSNYSETHYFGVTVLDNLTGVIDFSRSWYAFDWNNLDKYGFTIVEGSPSSMIITGLDRDENWTDGTGNSVNGQSNIFVYEFEKSTGDQVGVNYQFLVPHVEPLGDEFNFWTGQMPLIYYPDINYQQIGYTVANHVGYRTNPTGNFTETELIQTFISQSNNCDRIEIEPNHDLLTLQSIPVASVFVNATTSAFTPDIHNVQFTQGSCDPALSIEDNSLQNEIKLSPNPTKDFVSITVDTNATFTLINIQGQILQQGKLINGDNSLDVSQHSSGMYFLNIKTENGSKTLKLIKQ